MMLVLVLVACAIAPATARYREWTSVHFVPVSRLDTYPLFVDVEPIGFTIRGGLAPWQATATELRHDRRLWQRLHLVDWDTVPAHIRIGALDVVMAHYRHLLTTPRAWDAMGPDDWDKVPQPVRTVAYRQMIAYWSGFYHVGGAYGLDPVTVRDTMAAIAMQESWFDHRAVSVSRNGNRDLGLAQASNFARARMAAWHIEKLVDIEMKDADFFDPWKATRFLAIWMRQLLNETAGDLDLAVRAYHRGSRDARDARGAAYLTLVQQRRSRFIRNQQAPPSWSQVWHIGRAVEREEWSWLAPHGRLQLAADDE